MLRFYEFNNVELARDILDVVAQPPESPQFNLQL